MEIKREVSIGGKISKMLFKRFASASNLARVRIILPGTNNLDLGRTI